MARQPRFFVPGAVLHVIQRGNNRAPIFAADEDFRRFLGYLEQASRLHRLSIHAYVLMTNHLHLVATAERKESLPKVMQSVGRCYVQHYNSHYRRTGTLWEGRYRATVIDSERYLLVCMRYVELNPVRAAMVKNPSEYPWSSYRANGEDGADSLVTRHELYQRLGTSPGARREAYRYLFLAHLLSQDLEAIREATNKNWALGNHRFKQRIEELSGRRSERLRKGRPARMRATENRV